MILFETSHLQVRQLTLADLDRLFAIFKNPAVTRWMGDGSPLNRAACEKWIAISKQNYITKGFGASAVIENDTAEFIGVSGIVYDPERGEPEIIYAFAPHSWSKGYASELVPAMLGYGIQQCQLPYILATIAPENKASQRVVEKAGMLLQGSETDSDGLPTLVYRYPR